jgi:fructose-1,6-bisphosphatase II
MYYMSQKVSAQQPKTIFANLALDFVGATEAAAIASARWIGKGDGKAADKAAVDAMRERFNAIDFCGEIVIGEGAKDESFELFIGERLGCKAGEPFIDIAVDPLECTSSVAYGRPNALTVIATGPSGTLYKAADSYMEKIAVGPAAANVIDLDAPAEENIRKVSRALGKDISEITVAVLERPRHEGLIKEIRASGARVRLFTDGDIAMALAPSLSDNSVDMLMGTGGSAEAVLAAAALRCLGGAMLCRWKPKDEKHIARLKAAGITKYDEIFSQNDLARGHDLTFTATGVIGGPLLSGVQVSRDSITTHSVVMSTHPNTVRFITTRHAAI